MMKYLLISAIVLILAAGLTACGNNTNTTTSSLQETPLASTYPVEIVYVKNIREPGQMINPAGPEIEMILKNVADKGIIALEVTLLESPERDYTFYFGVSASHPLASGKSASTRKTLIGGGWGDSIPYSLHISGAMEGGETFDYIWESPGQ